MSRQSIDKMIGSFIFYGIVAGLCFRLMKWTQTVEELSPAVHVLIDSLAISLIIYSGSRALFLFLGFSSRYFASLNLLATILAFPMIVQFMVVKYFNIQSTGAKIALFILALGISCLIHITWNQRAFRRTTVVDITDRENEFFNSNKRE